MSNGAANAPASAARGALSTSRAALMRALAHERAKQGAPMTTTTNTETTTTTTSKAKVADRYAALAAHAAALPGIAFTPAKRPTAKDCADLSEMIAKYEAGLAEVIEMAAAAPVVEAAPVAPRAALVEALATLDAVDGGTSAAVLTAPATERDEARSKFFNATKATKAHAYALLAAATGDGDRRALLRAKLAELPEAIRAGACKIAMTLVVAGGSMHDDLKAVHDEQPAVEVKRGRTGGSRNEWTISVYKTETAYVRLPVDMRCKEVTVKRAVIDGVEVLVVVPHK